MKGNEFSANASALGYLHQIRYALWVLMNADSDDAISIELVDDVALHQNGGTAFELLQSKHSVNSRASLTDSSEEIWKTFRVWLTLVRDKQIQLDKVVLSLVTTSSAPKGAAAESLRPHAEVRNVASALLLLTTAAEKSKRQSTDPVKQGMELFLALSTAQKTQFLNKVKVIDASANILETHNKILKQLRLSTKESFIKSLDERLEGWWFDKVVRHLVNDSKILISYREFSTQLYDISSQFRDDNLPIDFLNAIMPTKDSLPTRERIFVEQLRLVMVSDRRVAFAVNNYFCAFRQRSKWIREGLIGNDELDSYETRLCREWNELFGMMEERVKSGMTDEQIEEQGRELYNQINSGLELNIRFRCNESYVMRGSFHMLANDLKVGWHIQFLERLRHLVGTEDEA